MTVQYPARPVMPRGTLEQLQNVFLNTFPYRCVVMRNRNAGCTRCSAACTSGAIAVENGAVATDASKCVGCGTCASVCPTGALEARHPGNAQLAGQASSALVATGGTAVVICDALWRRNAARIDPGKAVRVTCLGRMEESQLVKLAAQGAERILLAHSACEVCPRSAAIPTYGMVVESTNKLLETWGADVRVELRERVPPCVRVADVGAAPGAGSSSGPLPIVADNPSGLAEGELPTPPRTALEFAQELAREESVTVEEIIARYAPAPAAETARPMKVMLDGTLPHFMPDTRERLLDALAELGEPQKEEITTRLWGHVCIDVSRCRSCCMCAVFCPTGAISKIEGPEGQITLEHRPSDCVECRCCVDICPTGALCLDVTISAPKLAAGAVVERVDLPPITDGRGKAHSIIGALRKIIHIEQIYER